MAAPAPFRGLRHGRAQTVHVVSPVAVITEQQLVLGGETRPAGTLGAWAPETGWGAGAGAEGGGGGGWVPGPFRERAGPAACTEESTRPCPSVHRAGPGFCNYRVLGGVRLARHQLSSHKYRFESRPYGFLGLVTLSVILPL